MASQVWLVVLFLIIFVSAADYYKTLDGASAESGLNTNFKPFVAVDKLAASGDIRAAYKRLSKKYHPDKNKSPDAEERFVQIARGESTTHSYQTWSFYSRHISAYEVLSDDEVSTPHRSKLVHAPMTSRNGKFMTDLARSGLSTYLLLLSRLTSIQDGVKAHEEGHHHHHQNPFDIFSSFFGGRVSLLHHVFY